jgi:hypothetical protein
MGVLIWSRHISKAVILSMNKFTLATLLIFSCSSAWSAIFASDFDDLIVWDTALKCKTEAESALEFVFKLDLRNMKMFDLRVANKSNGELGEIDVDDFQLSGVPRHRTLQGLDSFSINRSNLMARITYGMSRGSNTAKCTIISVQEALDYDSRQEKIYRKALDQRKL